MNKLGWPTTTIVLGNRGTASGVRIYLGEDWVMRSYSKANKISLVIAARHSWR